MKISEVSKLLQDLAIEAGKMMTSAQTNKLKIDEKSSFQDLVTNLDKEIQNFCIKRISQAIPTAKFFAEENGQTDDVFADDLFVIDPIDGTTNFIHNYNYSSISIAWLKGGRSVLGIVYNPFVNEFYYAEAGKGAYLNGKRISVSKGSLRDSVTIFGSSPYNLGKRRETMIRVLSVSPKCQDIRRFGSAALDICHVASGEAGLFFESELSFWDFAAAEFIVKEAGGIVVDYNGNEILPSPAKSSVVAGSRKIVEESGMINFHDTNL